MTETLAFRIERRAARLDAFLAAAHPAISRSRWKQLIETRKITAD